MNLEDANVIEPNGAEGVTAAPRGQGTRRPYQPPRILSREPLESIAVICLKAVTGSCTATGVPPSS
jgi:hypothetical protein